MKKKILIGLGLVVIAVASYIGYGILFPKSPPGEASISSNGLNVKVTYSRPSKRGRLIFGEVSAGALLPYGKYWRLGANAATEITFSRDINFGGQPVNAGSYRMYAVPGASTFQIILNSELGVTLSGASEPDHSKDVLKIDVPVQTNAIETETFTINFVSDSGAIRMDFLWDTLLLSIPITAQ